MIITIFTVYAWNIILYILKSHLRKNPELSETIFLSNGTMLDSDFMIKAHNFAITWEILKNINFFIPYSASFYTAEVNGIL